MMHLLLHGENMSFPTDLAEACRRLDLGDNPVFPAWELSRIAFEAAQYNQNDMNKVFEQSMQKALMIIITALYSSMSGGGTRLPIKSGDCIDYLLDEMDASEEDRKNVNYLLHEISRIQSGTLSGELAAPISSIIGKPGDYCPLILDNDCLYMQKMHVLETSAVNSLNRRISAPFHKSQTENAISDVIRSQPYSSDGKMLRPDKEQVKALKIALSGNFTIISGKPGSGKTSIIANLLRVHARLGLIPTESIVLSAPTGKAAEKMRSSVEKHLLSLPEPSNHDQRLAFNCPPALTLHRLLGYSPSKDRFLYNEKNPLSEELVIVDESSMLDLAMADRLLSALKPGATLILLGDADQIPPVDSGAVLSDLLKSEKVKKSGRAVFLKKSYRAIRTESAGRKILDAADHINKGLFPDSNDSEGSLRITKNVHDLRYDGVELLDTEYQEESRLVFLDKWINRILISSEMKDRLLRTYSSGPEGFNSKARDELDILFSHIDSFRILCPTRIHGAGCMAVNDLFVRRLMKLKKSPEKATEFFAGTPVIVTGNDYRLKLFNGDTGIILNVSVSGAFSRREPVPMAVFPGRGEYSVFPLDLLIGKLEPAWAITIHKAQGSEYDHVAVMLPDIPLRPLSRELLYTAITRARKSVVIVGPPETMKIAIKMVISRESGIAEGLG